MWCTGWILQRLLGEVSDIVISFSLQNVVQYTGVCGLKMKVETSVWILTYIDFDMEFLHALFQIIP